MTSNNIIKSKLECHLAHKKVCMKIKSKTKIDDHHNAQSREKEITQHNSNNHNYIYKEH